MEYVIGGEMSQDIEHLANASAESMRLDRLVKAADEMIHSCENREVSDIWNSLTPAQKKAAVIMAEKQRKDAI